MATSFRNEIFDLFIAVLDRDREEFAPPWLVNWDYQDNREGEYPDHYPQRFDRYDGPKEIAKWFNWSGGSDKPNYLPAELVRPLINASVDRDREIFHRHGIPFDRNVATRVGLLNAWDYLFTHFYSVPRRAEISRILDFGAGFGRQANLLSRVIPDVVYVAMDAIPYSYCLQHFYLGNLDTPIFDYVIDPNSFSLEQGPGLYHLPTWRHDLLPDGFFDLVMCVQVLPELSPRLALFMLQVFKRVIKPGGMLYLRDHAESDFNPAGIDLEPFLKEAGFVLEFRPFVRDKVDIHGIPRVWRRLE